MILYMWLVALIFVLGCAIWAFIITGITGKIVIAGVVIVFAVLSLSLPEYRLWFNITAIAFGIGCYFYAKWHS